ncbi:DNA polymerase [Mariprofundus aestuarium]|uniref:Type-4 uracil-DNA glycosylase n=1 Tax=Mariprofundus aestuarium TaxID=1921086 RepID=A0A2K8KW56_MARES|nr:uracil-DNA glycosylase [Mariprofundus aestuarium]ATX78872.1 DNA polymerase [Mariprofundus aestuarium]
MQTPVSLFASGPAISAPEVAVEEKTALPATEVHAPAVDSSVIEISSVEVSTSGGLSSLEAKAATCRLCSLAETRTQVVFGTGNPSADIVFIGEAPGRDEDLKGEPFVGRAGQLLDRMLSAIGMDRNQVYIMNTIKCRPPNNRDPKIDEVQACNLWFEQQLALLQPKVICLLGRVAAQTVLETDAPLGSLRGHWHNYQGMPVWVTYHPAYLLRSPTQKQKSWQDLQQLVSRYREIKG